MNFFDAELMRNESGKYQVRLGGKDVELSIDAQENLRRNNTTDRPVTLGIRPEHIMLTDNKDESFTGIVDVSEMLGGAIHLHVKTNDTDAIIVVQTLDLMQPQKAFAHGSEIHYKIVPRLVHLFDTETGVNLEN